MYFLATGQSQHESFFETHIPKINVNHIRLIKALTEPICIWL